MNWEEVLIKRGFILLESATKTWGNGKFTGSIVEDVFYPFLHGDDPRKPNLNFQSIKLNNEDDLNKYLHY